MAAPPIRMLYFVGEPFPCYRSDIEVLFGCELLGRGHQIDLVMPAASQAQGSGALPWHERTAWVGPTVAGSGAWPRLRRLWLAFWHDLRGIRLVRADHYDAVQIRDKFFFAALLVCAARLRGLKFFYWLSFPEPESQRLRVRERTARYPIVTFLRGWLSGLLLYRWILPLCDHAFVQSEQMRRDIAAHGIDGRKLTPVPMGVAATDVSASRPAPADERGTLTLAYLGTLNAQRRLEVLVEMLAELRGSGHALRLLFVGGSDEAGDVPRLERRAVELGVRDCIEITGFLPRAQALARVRGADIGLSPFYPTPVLNSTSPTKLIEYLALGLPVVANDHPEQRLILRESGAGVCVPWGARYFARGVAWLAARSAAERRQLGEGGRQWVLKHRTYARIADELEQKYLELLRRPERATTVPR